MSTVNTAFIAGLTPEVTFQTMVLVGALMVIFLGVRFSVDRLCGIVVRVRFPALTNFLRNSGSGTGSTQPREDN
jgi:hypothetical protein